jgi:hypothetical protein
VPEPEEPPEPDTPEAVWRSQEEQHPSMQIRLTTEELCAMARSREKMNVRVIRALMFVAAALAGAFLYNIYRIDQPWIRLGQAWTLGVLVYVFAPALEPSRLRVGAREPCAQFLERQHEERQRGYLRIRRRLFLFIPGMAASWWGRTPSIAAKARDFEAFWRFPAYAQSWLFLLCGMALVLVWFAFGKAADKAAHDRDEIRRSVWQ